MHVTIITIFYLRNTCLILRCFNYCMYEATDQFAGGLCWAGLSQCVNIPTNRDLSPDARLRLLREPTLRVHYQHAIGCQSVHVTVRVLPFCGFFLWASQNIDDDANWCVFYTTLTVKEIAFVYLVGTYRFKSTKWRSNLPLRQQCK